MIIVEGPDGAGKTTLIKSIQELTGFGIAPRVVSKETKALFDLKVWVEDNLDLGPHDAIYDRYRLISEFIYGPILRTTQQPGFTDIDWVLHNTKKLYKRLDPIVIYCLPPLEVIKGNLENDPDNTQVVNHIEQIYTAYLNKVAMDALLRPTRTIIHDYTDTYPGETEGFVLGLLADRKAERNTQ
ncbi:thymidylate kinase [Microbacterium phage Triscuit]|nr:thymidylate kinase [Microbacterium phage Triscuit]